jgi:hypothetical protein
MRNTSLLILALALAACGKTEPPSTPADAIAAQAELSPDPRQKELWEAAAKSGPPAGLEKLHAGEESVATRERVVIPDQAVSAPPRPLGEGVAAGARVVDVPRDLAAYSGQARVTAVRAENQVIELDVGKGASVRLQAKARNGSLRIAAGETVQVAVREGDPAQRNDLVAIRAKDDDFAYSLVGGNAPVRLDIEMFKLIATQAGEAKGNSMDVAVAVGNERRTLAPGDEAAFKVGLTVKVVSSVAAQGEDANRLPEAYRLELLVWRTAPDGARDR